MSIIKILNDKNKTDAEKLEAVAEIVAGAREGYGNAKADIPAVKCETTHGALPFDNLEDESKVEILRNEAMNIKAQAIAFVEHNPGSVLNMKGQELVAVNPYFANVAPGTQFDIL